jgi:hypothetical protein
MADRAAAKASRHDGSAAGIETLTGRDRSMDCDPGTHSTRHASHAAFAWRRRVEPAGKLEGGVISVRRSTRPGYPNVPNPSVRILRGVGHWSGPAVKPSGRSQVRVVAMPESPGFFQYTCQSASISRTSATVNGLPRCTLVVSETRDARTWLSVGKKPAAPIVKRDPRRNRVTSHLRKIPVPPSQDILIAS